ncbi:MULTISPECIES: hypothetical protein [unclassified Paenibacillus]|uniref:sacsin N-terminal ATP-binding-like domain-containing protein n=1 Tax=unclassified Paenibacillus TaxID=185978 RepID=UPI001AE37D4E|nr:MULTISPECIES: hypothetical protein [unclassified Paenibacillus]MBP1153644.1 hypothetical protein [Paenibacillus sp. PvP091]MBP1170971.1 hypothetical protein [Paenibacillus sp. PvR098]MBP2441999.1 hypothetical protein [Paenibacillus sp. PvP052]
MPSTKELLYMKKTLDASSNVIWNEMKKIKESSDEIKMKIRRRWIWELIQNASDCTIDNQKVDINISYENKTLTFSHNGQPFTYENLLDLITQISSKQSSPGEKSGKFGTGFMSTHLLSEVVNLQGPFICDDNKKINMNFSVNRTGSEYNEFRENTKKMLESLEELNNSISEKEIVLEETKFIYSIGEKAEIHNAIQEGIKELEDTVPLILTFNRNINSITCNGNKFKISEERELTSEDNYKITKIKVNNKGEINDQNALLVVDDGLVEIACFYKYNSISKTAYLLPISEKLAKLFCRFPLVGTEKFSFPIFMNSKLFEVELDRDGIRDNNEINFELIKRGVSLYEKFLDFVSNEKFSGHFNICHIGTQSTLKLQKYCYDNVNKKIENTVLIPVNYQGKYYGVVSYKNKSNQIQISIPTTKSGENVDQLWELINQYGYLCIPTKESYRGWSKILGSTLSFQLINEKLLQDKSIADINTYLGDAKVFEWLNSFYKLWIEEEGINTVSKNAYVPNQNSKFVHINTICFDKDIDFNLKEILCYFEPNLLAGLLNTRITAFDDYFSENKEKIKSNIEISNSIDRHVSQVLSKETIDRVERTKDNQMLFNKLTNWFMNNVEKANAWFSNLYQKRMMLSTPEENLRRYKIAEKIEENNIKYEDLDDIITNREKVYQIISNAELSTEDMVRELKHIVTSSAEYKQFVDRLINRSIKNVYGYLSTNTKYEVSSTFEEWIAMKFSDTVFAAKYNGRDVRIIIRPSDNQHIIFYSDQELEALDDIEYQLWTDDGNKQRLVTLGDILKTTGISRIPLKKI